MTSWQGNEGGWNPQQDPYGQQYGSDPYPSPQYGADPYSAYGPGGTAGYPAYQSGYGAPPPPPEPPKRSRLPIVLSLVAILAVVGTTITILVLNRGGDPAPAAGGAPSSPSSTSRRPSSSGPRLPSSSRRPTPSATKPPNREGWTTVTMVGGTYQVPADWKKTNQKRDSGLDVQFDEGAEGGAYNCGGKEFFRGFAASGEVQSRDGSPLDLNKTVTDFAGAFAKTYYTEPKIDLPAPTATTASGKNAAVVTAKLTITPASAECEATTGEVAVVGVEIDKGGKPTGVRMVVVVNDLAGGPATPPALPDALAEQILETVSVS